MADTTSSPSVIPQHSLLGGAENMKLLFDDVMAMLSRQRKNGEGNDNAWEAVKLSQAQNDLRRQQNAATIDHLAQLGLLQLTQTGATENQQTVSPAGTAASETAKGAVADAGAGIAVSAEGVATANQAIADSVANLVASLTAIIVAATGNASSTSK